MALSHKLWLTARFYPLTPAFPFLKPIPTPFDWALFFATLVALAASALTPRLIPVFATLAVVLAIFDQSRLQPWFYQGVFLLLGVAFASPNACRVILASTYFWSGAQKLNAGFFEDTFPRMIDPLLAHLPRAAQSSVQSSVHPMAIAAAFIELWIGIALLGKKFRAPAVVAAVAMHACLLLLTQGAISRTWNIAMAAAVVILFWKAQETAPRVLFGRNPFHIGMVLLFGFMPLLSFFGLWDHSLFPVNRGTIYISQKLYHKLPASIAAEARVETPEIASIDIHDWSMHELKVPPYAEIRIFKSVARAICGYAENSSDARLSVLRKSTVGKSITSTSFTCAALKDR